MPMSNWVRWCSLVPAMALAAPAFTGAVAHAATVPDFSMLGFPQVVAQATIQPEAPATLSYGTLTVRIPAHTFTDPVKFELLEGPTSAFVDNAPAGTTPLVAFAFKVVDLKTGALVGKFNQAVSISYTNPAINAHAQYWDITPTGAYAANPVMPTIQGDTLSHPIAAALVGWVISAPAPAAPDFTQDGFPQVVGSVSFMPGHPATVSGPGVTVSIPGNAFTVPVTFQLLEGPLSHFTAQAPAGQAPVADFAFKVVNPATGALIDTFNAPVKATITNPRINAGSRYYDISPSGAYSLNPVPPVIQGDSLSHGIAVSKVGWVITSPVVAGATSPVTGLPLAPLMAAGGALVALGVVYGLKLRRS
ncbi:conserved exported protein of unknown function [Candidatus Hydrogenisulfobacillus filiaventi]|uniref:Uncharacterized protein n=1 Tax=Candidatus Hydrogenisulfobacillus filiaventi TaxID=2707344 RepID=A0A6F8ZIN1_9FIRM|nr:hypothetical protein [Bacillota bacterium]CAB1129739.1 conserved exported protein of unknown function [Candidatus Hydrogenisulfobacillus filiaventi]